MALKEFSVFDTVTKKYIQVQVEDGQIKVLNGGAAGAVTSVFGRTGIIVATEADYTGDQINVDEIGAATYDDVQDFITIFGNAGWISGGVITDNGDGTIDVAAGVGFIRVSNSETADLKFFDWAASAGVSLTNNSENYIYIDYNAGSPQVAVTTSGSTIRNNENSQFELAEIYREGTTLHITNNKQYAGKLNEINATTII